MASECDAILRDGVKRKFQFDAGSITSESVREFFFSDSFERYYRNSQGNYGLVVPLFGVPITFGGSSASQNAWELRQREENAKGWDFSQITWKSVLVETGDKAIIDAWLACVAHQQSLFEVREVAGTADSVVIQVNYSRLPRQVGMPKFVRITATGGIDATTVNRENAGTEIEDGSVFTLPWLGDASEAAIFVETSLGDTAPIVVRRLMPHVVLRYSIRRDSSEWDKPIKTKTVVFETVDMNGRPVASLMSDPVARALQSRGELGISHDKKWLSHVVTATLAVDSPDRQRILGTKLVQTYGPGTHVDTLRHDKGGPDCTAATVQLSVYTRPSRFEFSADIFERGSKDIEYSENVEVGVDGLVVVDLPESVIQAKIEYGMGVRDRISVPPSADDLAHGARLEEGPVAVGAKTRYKIALPR